MFLQLDQKSLFLGRKPNGFTETYYTEWDDGLGKSKISLFLVMSIGSSQVPGEEIGKEAFQLLQDHYLDDLSGDPYDRFENALREVNLMISDKEKTIDMKFVPNVHVVCGVIEKDMLFLSQRGDAQGYLIRKRHVSSITEGLFDEKNTEDLFQNIASGVLEVNDSVILVTGKLVQYVTPSELSKVFSEQSLMEAVKELEEMLSGDIEEQMALLTFDILEKSESKEIFVEREIKHEKSANTHVNRAKMALSEVKWGKPIHILREWAVRQERLKVLDGMKTWGRDKILIAVVAAIVILVGGVGYLSLHLSTQKVKDVMLAKLDTAEENINEAGTKGGFDKKKASSLLDDAQALAVEVLDSEYYHSEASEIIDKVSDQRDYLDNVVRVENELIKLADFTSTSPILGIAPYKDRIVGFTDGSIFQILIDQVEAAIKVDGTAIAGNYFVDQQKLLLLTSEGKLVEYEDGNTQFADTADVEWKKGNSITSYSSKVYILDAIGNQIWKYTHGRTAYSSATAYFSDAVDLSKAVSFAIDGSIWTVDADGTIRKFLSGKEVTINFLQAPLTPVERATKIYTELDMSQIYILDSDTNTILVYTKSTRNDDLTYSSQYRLDGIKDTVKDMYYDRIKSMLYMATDTALYEIKL